MATSTPRPRAAHPFATAGWWIVAVSSLAIVIVASRYLTLNPDVFFPEQRAIYVANRLALVTHVAGGILALLLGPLQFVPAIRRRWPGVHRALGRGYLVGIAAGGLAGLWMAQLAFGGSVAKAGFTGLAVAWLLSSAMAVIRIRAGDVTGHRAWMTRSFALTFAAVTLRLYLPVPLMLGLDFAAAYAAIAWLCWVPNLIVAEGLIRYRASRTTIPRRV